MSKKEFKIQIPTSIVRSNSINAKQFVLLSKFIQAYYLAGSMLTYQFNYKVMMNHLNIKDNKTFKEVFNGLYDQGFIHTQIDELPRKEIMEVTLNTGIIPGSKKDIAFTQISKNVLDKAVIKAISHVGVRLLYYYKSYINTKDYNKQYAHPSEEVIAADLGITKKTVINYNRKLEKCKFIKIEKHNLSHDNEYILVGGREIVNFTKYNNHYFIRQDKIDEFVIKNREHLVELS